MTEDRRATSRCPKCSGPTRADSASPEGIRCRTSTCLFNHAQVRCPRCGETDLESVEREGEQFSYTCANCQARFKL
jgi:DNA-directed RNA polymerase subunit RPC12/RpoP